jgi:hypothetical protein
MVTERLCDWCRGELPPGLGTRARFHGRKCRQAYWRARRSSLLQASDGNTKRAAYADPPFPGLSRKYYRRESSYAGEVDHAALVAELRAFDGWALSTSAKALREVWNLCPEARLAVWVKPQRPRNRQSKGAHNVFECVLFVPVRRLQCDDPVPDALIAGVARGDGSSLPGRKPRRFCQWLFALLGLRAGDSLKDRFPGSGGVGRVWLASLAAVSDGASPGDGADDSAELETGEPAATFGDLPESWEPPSAPPGDDAALCDGLPCEGCGCTAARCLGLQPPAVRCCPDCTCWRWWCWEVSRKAPADALPSLVDGADVWSRGAVASSEYSSDAGVAFGGGLVAFGGSLAQVVGRADEPAPSLTPAADGASPRAARDARQPSYFGGRDVDTWETWQSLSLVPADDAEARHRNACDQRLRRYLFGRCPGWRP